MLAPGGRVCVSQRAISGGDGGVGALLERGERDVRVQDRD